MDLKNNQIKAGQILNNQAARAVLYKYFPILQKNQKLLYLANELTLEQVINMAKAYVPKAQIDACISELSKI